MNGLDQHRVRPRSGPGLLARLPGLVAVIDTTDPAEAGEPDPDPAGLVLDACRQAAVDGPTVAEAVWVRLEALHAAGVTALPPFALVADGEAGQLVAIAHGDASVRADGPAGPTDLTGGGRCAGAGDGGCAGLTRRALPGPITTVDVIVGERGDADGDEDLPARAELGLGVVPAAGCRLRAAAARLRADVDLRLTASRPEPPTHDLASGHPATVPAAPLADAEPSAPIVRPRDPERAAFVSVALVAPDSGTGHDVGGPSATVPDSLGDEPPSTAEEAARRPLPIAGTPTDEDEVAMGAAEEIPGLRCIEGHLNDPADPSCRVCGAPLAGRTGSLETGPRPPLGLLVFDDGAGFVLDHDYVIGRAPTEDARVRSGRARPLVVDDDEGRSVSRVHAEIRLDGWQVLVIDRGSTNGTFVWESGAWTRLTPSEPRRLRPGDRAAVGQRVCTLEATGVPVDQPA